MRIIAGRFRGTALAGVGGGDPARRLRPTSDRARESLFNLLAHRHGDPVPGARVLDLFAGTGALGLEALSRGAAHVTFVDDGAVAGRLIRANIDRLGIGAETRLRRRDATKPGENDGPPFGLVFLDPPYGRDLAPRALAAADAGGWLAAEVLAVVEDSAPVDAPRGFAVIDGRALGAAHLTFLARS